MLKTDAMPPMKSASQMALTFLPINARSHDVHGFAPHHAASVARWSSAETSSSVRDRNGA